MKKEKEAIENKIVKALTQKKFTITTAESCTGGLLAGRLVNVSGVSKVFNQGFITYSNKAKRKQLKVSKESLEKNGAASKQVAKEMAKGAAFVANTDVALAITGVAGPDGGTDKKPVGLVYICCYCEGKTVVKEYYFKGNRQEIRESSVEQALLLVLDCIK